MSDWKAWDKLLGPGRDTESTGASSEPDQNGRKGSVIIRCRSDQGKNGRAIFEVFMEAKPANFAPTGAKIASLEVEGFDEDDCTGRKKCAKHHALPANANLLKLVPGSKFSFEPIGHDGGILSQLLAQCNCDVEGVESYKIYVEVEFIPNPPNPPNTVRFSSCFPCDEIDDEEIDV
jgi:hypothetical protein